ncbi:hypothetical protein [Nevskia ramosa]|uniref:hypothetical protein n=1 Tax=Nevskia ramosa TaxID=64002 RepID=UPI003D0D9234
MNAQKLQATISGYGLTAATLYGAVNPETGALLIARSVEQDLPRKGTEFLKVGTPGMLDCQIIFKPEFIGDAIEAWRQLKSTGRLQMEASATRHDPDSRIQVAKVRTTGSVYEIAPDVTSGQIAALAMAWLALQQVSHNRAAGFSAAVAASVYRVQPFGYFN